MRNSPARKFQEIWAIHFEFAKPSQHQIIYAQPTSLTAFEIKSECKVHHIFSRSRPLTAPPFSVGENTLIVVYDASEQIAGFLGKEWQIPPNILDLFSEFRCLTNGLRVPCGNGLTGALAYFGLDAFAIKCATARIKAIAQLFSALAEKVDWPRALLRGAYGATVAKMERTGVPLDQNKLTRLTSRWDAVRRELVASVDLNYGVFDGVRFDVERFSRYLREQSITWPKLGDSQLDLRDKTFKKMCLKHPQLESLRQIRSFLAQAAISTTLAIEDDGRSRCKLSMFASRTGRNQPSSNRFIFGLPVWVRGLIRPKPGYGLAHIDILQQEFGIAAGLAKDEPMMQAYQSGDPYITFARQAGAVPNSATKQTHPTEREQFKTTALAVLYGMGAESLAEKLALPPAQTKGLLDLHKSTYRKFWSWSDAVVNEALLRGRLKTVFGWQLQITENPNERSLRNFPMQANGAEILRLICMQLDADGITVCAPIHDAVLIEAPLSELSAAIKHTQRVVRQISAVVLDGFWLDSDATVVRYPDHYLDARGQGMWNKIVEHLDKVEKKAALTETAKNLGYLDNYFCAN